jgi:protein-serine/threonine kinase
MASSSHADPQWANPIKNRIRQNDQQRANEQTMNALQPSISSRNDAGALGPLRVVNGVSTSTSLASSMMTNAAQENFSISHQPEGLPSQGAGRPGNSTIRWGGGLAAHQEVQEDSIIERSPSPVPEPPKPDRIITPSLSTLEKAVAARIFFENVYFPLFRKTPSREQRRLAMEKDMAEMRLNHAQKEELRKRWRQNETDYLREQRRKINVSAFIKLKTIGHGSYNNKYTAIP